MLTRELIRYDLVGDRVQPRWLKATPAIMELAQRLLDHWRGGIGKNHGDLDDGAIPILHGSRALIVGKGLNKVIVDACRWSEPPARSAYRAAAFAACAIALRAPAATVAEHAAKVAADIQETPEQLTRQLYDDHPDHALLNFAPMWTVSELLGHYHTALAQALLLHASHVEIRLESQHLTRLRHILRTVRFGRLVALVSVLGDSSLGGSSLGGSSSANVSKRGWQLTIDGPLSVFDRNTAYGLQFAQLLPALAGVADWSLRANLRDGARDVVLELDHHAPLVGRALLQPGYMPEELRDLSTKLATTIPEWTACEPQPLTLPNGEVVAPDLAFSHGDRVVAIELLHRWHVAVARRRLDQLAQGWAPDLCIGIDRGLLKRSEGAGLDQHPAFAGAGFLFSDIPSPTAITALLRRSSSR